ncbi:phospholipid-translocating P-type ATPase, flippase family protein [Histomonas meleagridis]|uniref:phospholipid-translocating P-type ATPase, flippase family protein n=1 Tax=Histomonas meleagridis TaxID=135588 RepID=UPI00355AAD47|nr:phospholipid-translocating P-type ATPase, flippase family protein [Histomonas meleagridis]KAH0805478.1 phospholipid-translocating P-type ATPase, flippase family protein [Histomonas meleagridis]
MLLPGVSVSPITAAFPLFIVVGISAVREAIEDWLRHCSDKVINDSVAHVLKNSEFVDTTWKELLVGDIIKIEKDEQVPADIVVLSTESNDGITYIDTRNLDGESNLKIRQACFETFDLHDDPLLCTEYQATICCDEPNNFLYTFNGFLKHNEETFPLDNQQTILRGCVIRNTKYVVGVVVYTGRESKIMMNSSSVRTKRSKLEKGLNFKIISVFVFQMILSLICTIIGYVFKKKNVYTGKYWYFYRQNEKVSGFLDFILLFVAHFVIINSMIPISLYVTLEVVRVFQALFTAWDSQMYDPISGVGAKSRTTNISDDLGQVEYIFSDKTGTLTQNVMEFMKCSVAGNIYGHGTTEVAYAAAQRKGISIPPPNKYGKAFKDDEFMNLIENPPLEVMHFLWLLCLCHSVVPEKDPTKPYGISFQASSPDEIAIVSAAADFGYIFCERSQKEVIVQMNNTKIRVPILTILEFSSQRKRSSVIIRHPITNQIILYCKGADDLIMERLSKDSKYVKETSNHLKQFAADGLRTLCCAYKVIDEEYYQDWHKRYHEACCQINNRDEAIDIVSNEIECDLKILGATAIEDKLQDGVMDTIQSLLLGQINVWVITGDKRETAINIGYACSLLSNDMELIILDNDDPDKLKETLIESLDKIENNENIKLALIASGISLYHMLLEKNIDMFFKLSLRCKSVICCRVSPLQKKMIVNVIRKKTGKICLAIGDGANDVGMILEADIGVGISGKEGRQAVLASDYSFGQFRFLKKLLLFHGRCNFYRNVNLINYSFYKNMMFSFNQILFAIFCNFSGSSLYNSWLLSIVNVVFTSCPIIVYASIERDVSLNSMLDIPELYYFNGKRDWVLSYYRFWLSLLLGIFHSFITFFIPYFGMKPFLFNDGKAIGMSDFGVTVYACVIFIANLKIATMCTYWTWIHHVLIWGSILIFFPITLILC